MTFMKVELVFPQHFLFSQIFTGVFMTSQKHGKCCLFCKNIKCDMLVTSIGAYTAPVLYSHYKVT